MSRLTEKFYHNGFEYMATGLGANYPYAIDKLGKLEDLLQSYNVKDLDELDKLLEMATTYEELSKQIGCPLEVRCKVNCDSHIYDENGIKYKVIYVYEDHFDCEDPFDNDMGYTKLCAFDWKDYKITWWLKKDRSE